MHIQRSCSGRIVVVHAYEPPARPAAIDISIGSAAFSSWRDVEEAVVASIRQRVDDRVAGLADAYPTLTFEAQTVEGMADQVVIAAAEREGAARIVCGTHGRTGLQRFFLGSVAQRVAREAKVPVMIVKNRTA